MKKKQKLTEKQRAFVNEYCVDKNATQAATRAGYSPRTANEQGSRLLANVSVKALIDKKLAKLEEKAGLTAERVMREVAIIATSNVMDGLEYNEHTREFTFKEPDKIPPHFWRAAQEVTTFQLPDGGGMAFKVKMHPKLQALKMEYERHKLTKDDAGVTNNIANMHVNILDYNKAMRRIGEQEIKE